MNIAVVDDCKSFVDEFCIIIKNCCEKQNIDYNIEALYDGYSLMGNYRKYHLIFLDIDMPMISGLKVCEEINKRKGTADVPYIIFVTSKDNMVFKALRQRPYTFIRKSELFNDVFDCIGLLYSKLKNVNNNYIIKSGRDFVVLNLDDVLYLEKDKNYVIFYSNKLTYKERSNMDEKYADLCNRGFIRLHIGCIVNAKHISFFETNKVVLDNRKEFIVSKKYKDTAKKDYYDWLVKKYA